MAIVDDGDLVRGLGYVALYAAYLEEAVDECLAVLSMGDSAELEKLMRRPSSLKVEWLQKQISDLEPLSKELAQFPAVLDAVALLLEERNSVIHGRVYAVPGEGDIRYSGRRSVPTEPASSTELFGLANELFNICAPLNHASQFSLSRLLQAKADSRSEGL